MQRPVRILMIDNQDSFAYNLVDEFRQLGYELLIYRNQVPLTVIANAFDTYEGEQLLCLSPGPGHPAEASLLPAAIQAATARQIPILGICLGLQALLIAAGARVAGCGEKVHGKISVLSRCEHPVFAGLPSALPVARYHSLSGYDLPASAKVLAHYRDIPMAVEFPDYRAIGLQFHPESIMTSHGSRLLAQCVDYLRRLPQGKRK